MKNLFWVLLGSLIAIFLYLWDEACKYDELKEN